MTTILSKTRLCKPLEDLLNHDESRLGDHDPSRTSTITFLSYANLGSQEDFGVDSKESMTVNQN